MYPQRSLRPPIDRIRADRQPKLYCELGRGLATTITFGRSSKPPGEAIGNKGLGFRSVSGEVAIPKAAESWKNDVERLVSGGASLAYSTYCSIKGPLWWLPGQLITRVFKRVSRAIRGSRRRVAGAGARTVFRVGIAHRYCTSETRQWPTPVAAFLRGGKWMPADDPQPSGAVRGHFAPCDVWVAGAPGERFPYYLRQPAVALSKAIERLGEAGRGRLTKCARLRVLGERVTLLDQARFLADQFRRGTVNRHFEPQFINLYGATWRAIVDRYASDPRAFAGATAPECLVVRRGSELRQAGQRRTSVRQRCRFRIPR